MNEFEADIYETPTSWGMKLVPQVGCSQFRIDFGICHPAEHGRVVLAIECDGGTYHSSYTARDRDCLRQQQLQNLGWRFHRTWSTDWFLRKYEEVERAWSAYEAAVQHSDYKRDLSTLPPISVETDTPSKSIALSGSIEAGRRCCSPFPNAITSTSTANER